MKTGIKRKSVMRLTAYNRQALDFVSKKSFQKRFAAFTLLFMLFQVLSPFGTFIGSKGAHATADQFLLAVETYPSVQVHYTIAATVLGVPVAFGETDQYGNFAEGTVVTLKLTPDQGYKAVGWIGPDSACSSGDTCVVTLAADTVVRPVVITESSTTPRVTYLATGQSLPGYQYYPLVYSRPTSENLSVSGGDLYPGDSLDAETTATLTLGSLDGTGYTATVTGAGCTDLVADCVLTMAGVDRVVTINYSYNSADDSVSPLLDSNYVGQSYLTSTSVLLSLEVSELSKVSIEYGTTQGYGASAASRSDFQKWYYNGTIPFDISAVGERSDYVWLSGLAAGTLYHYRVKMTDQAGHVAYSVDHTIQTVAAPTPTPSPSPTPTNTPTPSPTATPTPTSTATPTPSPTSVPVTSVILSVNGTSVVVDGTTDLSATVFPANASNKAVTWTSSDASKATVNSSGVVTGVAQGSATITVTTQDGGKTDSALVTVTSYRVISDDSHDIDPNGPKLATKSVTGGNIVISFSSLPTGYSYMDFSTLNTNANSGTTVSNKQLKSAFEISALSNLGAASTLPAGSVAHIVLPSVGAKSTDTVLYWNGTSWSSNGISNVVVDASAGTVTFDTSHFSEFAVFSDATTNATPTPTGAAATSDGAGTIGGKGNLPEAGTNVLNILLNMLLAGALLSLIVMYSKRTKYANVLN